MDHKKCSENTDSNLEITAAIFNPQKDTEVVFLDWGLK